MDLNELKKLVELMESAKLVELEYDEQGKHVRLRRAEDKAAPVTAPAILPIVTQAVPAPAAPAAAPAPGPAPAAAKRPDSVVEFKSPLVGTFYRSPRPDAESFVNVGDEINADKVICIIEAMKVMNEIKAETRGIITQIVVDNSKPVEFGQPLFKLKPL